MVHMWFQNHPKWLQSCSDLRCRGQKRAQAGPQASTSPCKVAPWFPKVNPKCPKIGHRWSRSNLRQPQGSPNRPKAAHSGSHDSIFDQIQPQSGSSMQFLPSTSSQVRPCSNVSTTALCQARPYNFVCVSHKFVYVSPESGPRSVHSV